MALTSLSVKIEVDEVKSQFIFTDLIDYNAYGYTTVSGLIKISGSQTGVVYKNPGWDADDYTSADILTPTYVKTISNTVPTGGDGLVVNQFYTIEYKISIDGMTTFLSFLEVFNNNYKRATLDLTSTISLKDSTLTFTDNSNYTLVLGGNSYSPVSQTRNITIKWPSGSAKADTDSSAATVALGPNIWSGIYSANLTVTLEYLLVNAVNGLTVTISDTFNQSINRIAVVYQDFTAMVNQALEQITAKYEALKEYNLPYAQQYQDILDDIMMYYDMFKMASVSGQDLSYSMEKIYELLQTSFLNLNLTLKEAEIIPPVKESIYNNFILPPPVVYTASDNVKTFTLTELINATLWLVMRGTQPVFEGKDFTFDSLTGSVTMTNPLSMYEQIAFWTTKPVT